MKKRNGKRWIFAPNRFQSVMVRLLLTFFLLLTPIFIMGLTIYQVGIAHLDRQIYYMLKNQVTTRVADMENQMTLAQTQLHQLCNENALQRLAGMPDSMTLYERYEQINTLQERLHTIRDANPLIRQVTVYLPKIDYMVRAVTFENDTWQVSALDRDVFESAWAISAFYPSKLVYAYDQILYASQLPLPTSIGVEREPRILFVLEYDQAEVLESFSGLLDGVNTASALVFAGGEAIGESPAATAWTNAVETLRNEETSRSGTLDLSDDTAYIHCVWSEQLSAWYVAYAPREEAFAELNDFRRFIVGLMILFALVLLIYGIRAYCDVHKPLKLLTGAFDRLAQGDMDFQIRYDQANEFSYLTHRFNRMVHQLKDAMNKLYEQRILMQQAQIKQLQTQINPHFLYNSLYILNNMVAMEDCEAAMLMSQSLGDYFRYITRNARDTVSLTEELEHAHSYVEVQRIRFGKRLRIEFPPVPPEAKPVMVPRLSIQPILENAFVHALERSDVGELIVRINDEGDVFRVEVENTGFMESEEWLDRLRAELDDDSPEREITGLSNVHRRLKLTFGTGLVFEKIDPDRLCVVLTFPSEGEPLATAEQEEKQ